MTDNFQGDNAKLVECIDALLAMDASGNLTPSGIGGHARALLEAAASRLLALSHAAGQEAPTNPVEIGRKSVGGEAVAWQCRLIAIDTGKLVDDWQECSKESFDIDGGRPRDGAYLRTEYRALYLTPAQPPASAEVGRLRELCGCAYQLAGYHDAPEAWLDALSDAAMGVPLSDWRVQGDLIEALLPYAPPAQAVAVAVAVDDAAIERFAAAYYGRGKTYEPERVRAALQAALSPIAGVTHGTNEGWGDE